MRVLFLSYYFPPMGGVGVQRALKFVKYMPLFGVEPTVLAADDPHYVSDASLLEQLSADTKVIRLQHTTLLNRLLASRRNKTKPSENNTGNSQPGTRGGLRVKTAIRDITLRYYAALQFPDDKYSWGEQAYLAALKAHAETPFDLIISTSPPVTSHCIAARLKSKLGIPWVADFRDLWTENEFYNLPVLRRWLDGLWEQRLLKQANGIVTVTEGFAASLRRIVPAETPVSVIYNGYDDADFINIGSMDKATERFLMVYTGTLYGKRSPEPFLQGLEKLLASEPNLTDKLCVRFIGNIGSRFEPLLALFEKRFPGVIERKAFVAHDQIPALLASADALLLLLGGESSGTVLPAKVFEYLRAMRPILFVGPPRSESSRLIEQTGHGIACDEQQPDEIATAIKHLMDNKCHFANGTAIERFERKQLTGQLVDFLREICHGK